jgi:hypothetical protein
MLQLAAGDSDRRCTKGGLPESSAPATGAARYRSAFAP